MVCKFRAETMPPFPSTSRSRLALAACLSLAVAGLPAQAEKADRNKPMVLEADRSGSMDLQRQIFVYDGNAVITQGTMVMRADRVEVRQTPDGFYTGQAQGSPGKPASWRQRRDGVDEVVEGTADRIDFDGRADTLRFVGNSAVRRLRGGVVADEITGGVIVWDNLAEVFRVEGGASTPVNPSGRVRAVLAPRTEEAASAPGGAAPAGTPGLTPSRSLNPASTPTPAPAAPGKAPR
jgi:lipopolysaccharide export system protein LptA